MVGSRRSQKEVISGLNNNEPLMPNMAGAEKETITGLNEQATND